MSTRPWHQVNLITAIVLMLLAGGLLWLNLRRNYAENSLDFDARNPNAPGLHYSFTASGPYTCGWPWAAYSHEQNMDFNLHDKHFSGKFLSDAQKPEWRAGGVILDTVVAGLILAAAAVLCEKLIRGKVSESQP